MHSGRFFVSVIIPVYNGDTFLAEAVESVQRQAHQPIEIIIVDDGSTDGTARVAGEFMGDVSYVYQPNSGPPVARNKGLTVAQGNVVGFLDADDMWTETKLASQLVGLASDSSVDIVVGESRLVRATGVPRDKPALEALADSWISLNLGTALFRRSVFDKVGLFDEALSYSDDWDWFMRARELDIPMIIDPQVVLLSRRHDHNLTNQRELNNRFLVRMLKKSLDRRRCQNGALAESLPKLSELRSPPSARTND